MATIASGAECGAYVMIMKRIIIFILSLLSFIYLHAQDSSQETAKPILDAEIVRKVARIDIEGKNYYNVIVIIKSIKPDYFFTTKAKVEITVVDSSRKIIWAKKLRNSYLYVFSRGQIQVGLPQFDKIVIFKEKYSDSWIGIIREYEGVFF